MSGKDQMQFIRDAIKKEIRLAKEASDEKIKNIHLDNINELVKASKIMEQEEDEKPINDAYKKLKEAAGEKTDQKV